MKHSKLEVLCAFVFIGSFVSCNPQRQGKGLGDMMENIWGGFSDQLDEFQVTSFFILVKVIVFSLINVIFPFVYLPINISLSFQSRATEEVERLKPMVAELEENLEPALRKVITHIMEYVE